MDWDLRSVLTSLEQSLLDCNYKIKEHNDYDYDNASESIEENPLDKMKINIIH